MHRLLKLTIDSGHIKVLTMNDETDEKQTETVPFKNWFYADSENAAHQIVDRNIIRRVEKTTIQTLSGVKQLIKVTHDGDVVSKAKRSSGAVFDAYVTNDLRYRLITGKIQSCIKKIVFCRVFEFESNVQCAYRVYADDAYSDEAWCAITDFSMLLGGINAELIIFRDETESMHVRLRCPGVHTTHAVLHMRQMMNCWLKKEMYDFVDYASYVTGFLTQAILDVPFSLEIMKSTMIDRGLLNMIMSTNLFTNTVIDDFNRPDIALYFIFSLFASVCSRMNIAIDVFKNEKLPFMGGMHRDPIKGLHTNVAMFDFKSMYPSLALDHGFDFINHASAPNKDRKNSVLYSMFKLLLDKRQSVKGTHQEKVIKRITNQIFGMFGNDANCHGLTSSKLASCFTGGGRSLNQRLVTYAIDKELSVLFADTDCIMASGFTESFTPTMFMSEFNQMLRSDGYVYSTLNYERTLDHCFVYTKTSWCGLVDDQFISKGVLNAYSYCSAINHAYEQTMRDIFKLNLVDVKRGDVIGILNHNLDLVDQSKTIESSTRLLKHASYVANVDCIQGLKDIKLTDYELLPVVDVDDNKILSLELYTVMSDDCKISLDDQRKCCISNLSGMWLGAFVNDGSRLEKKSKPAKKSRSITDVFNIDDLF